LLLYPIRKERFMMKMGWIMKRLMKTKSEKRTVTAHDKGKVLGNKGAFRTSCGHSCSWCEDRTLITSENVDGVKAKIIPEAANLPIPYETEIILMKRRGYGYS